VLDIKPKDVDRKSSIREVLAAFSDHVGGDWCPFAEMETKRLKRRQSQETSRFRQLLLDSCWMQRGAEHEELQHSTFTKEVNV